MSDHDACRRARHNAVFGRWECSRCDEVIGYAQTWPIVFVAGLHRIAKSHGGIKTYGPTNDVRLRGERPNERQVASPLRGREFYVYCPRLDCRAGQHVTLAR